MMLTIELNAMKFYAYHGVNEQETKVGNHFVVDVAYACPSENACLSDDLNDTISYSDVYHMVKTEMERPSKLLEHIAGRIAQTLKSTFPQLSYLKIKVSKINPPLGGETHSAAVTLEKTWPALY